MTIWIISEIDISIWYAHSTRQQRFRLIPTSETVSSMILLRAFAYQSPKHSWINRSLIENMSVRKHSFRCLHFRWLNSPIIRTISNLWSTPICIRHRCCFELSVMHLVQFLYITTPKIIYVNGSVAPTNSTPIAVTRVRHCVDTCEWLSSYLFNIEQDPIQSTALSFRRVLSWTFKD